MVPHHTALVTCQDNMAYAFSQNQTLFRPSQVNCCSFAAKFFSTERRGTRLFINSSLAFLCQLQCHRGGCGASVFDPSYRQCADRHVFIGLFKLLMIKFEICNLCFSWQNRVQSQPYFACCSEFIEMSAKPELHSRTYVLS
jgi:hypothetical protein